MLLRAKSERFLGAHQLFPQSSVCVDTHIWWRKTLKSGGPPLLDTPSRYTNIFPAAECLKLFCFLFMNWPFVQEHHIYLEFVFFLYRMKIVFENTNSSSLKVHSICMATSSRYAVALPSLVGHTLTFRLNLQQMWRGNETTQVSCWCGGMHSPYLIEYCVRSSRVVSCLTRQLICALGWEDPLQKTVVQPEGKGEVT